MWGALMLKPCSATRMGASTSASRRCAGITNASRGHRRIASYMRDLQARPAVMDSQSNAHVAPACGRSHWHPTVVELSHGVF
jgi:hypothetical protein